MFSPAWWTGYLTWNSELLSQDLSASKDSR
jgi:hypothetical protein